MISKSSVPFRALPGGIGRVALLAFVGAAVTACSGGAPDLPEPRPIVIRSGARLYAEQARMDTTDTWVRAQSENIEMDPTFMIESVPRDTPSYPWESLFIIADTAKIGVQMGFDLAQSVFQLYAHYHLMKEKGRIEEFLPGGGDLEGFALERAILARVADAWFLARAVYQSVPFEPLEEILYANENGYLDAMILTAREEEFEEERAAWLEEDPAGLDRYRAWFLETFSREPPGLRKTG
jgi:hypothetical protein